MAKNYQNNVDPLKDHPKYEKIKDLSHGTFGFVQLCKVRQSGDLVAVKFLERGPTQSKYVETEILNHRLLIHPHIVEFREVFVTKDFLCIAMEYANRGTLFDFIRAAVTLKEAAARWFFQQLIVAIDYCHRKGVVNRDVKLENTLLCDLAHLPLPLLKVCDFGYSKAQCESAPKSKVGTLAYMAPEVLRSERYDGKMADIWSCGVMLYVMLFGRYPFSAKEDPAGGKKGQGSHYLRIPKYDWSIPPGASVSPDCEDLLRRLLEVDLTRRLCMPDILNHPWFLVNLPEGVLHMNDGYLSGNQEEELRGVQSVEDIRHVLKEGAKPAVTRRFRVDYDEDELISDAIRHELNYPKDGTSAGKSIDFNNNNNSTGLSLANDDDAVGTRSAGHSVASPAHAPTLTVAPMPVGTPVPPLSSHHADGVGAPQRADPAPIGSGSGSGSGSAAAVSVSALPVQPKS